MFKTIMKDIEKIRAQDKAEAIYASNRIKYSTVDVRETLSKKFNKIPFYTWYVTKTYDIVEEVTYVGEYIEERDNSRYISNGFTFGDGITPNSKAEDILFRGSKEECEQYIFLIGEKLLKR